MNPRLAETFTKSSTASSVEDAASSVLAWLRESHRFPQFLQKCPSNSIASAGAEIVERFLGWAQGFTFDLVNNGSEDAPAWVAHWMYRGSTFEGFAQPPEHPDPEAARMLACAALLRNDWCRSRLR